MRTVLIASLRTHTRRYVAAVLAVMIGVTFVVVTDALASSTRDGLVAGVGLPYDAADVVVSDLDGPTAARLVDGARADGDSASVLGWTAQRVSGDDGVLADRVDVAALADDPRQRWQVLEDGRFPEGDGEAVADVNAAKSSGVEVGDRITVGAGADAATVTVVGLVDSPSASVGAALYLPWDVVASWADGLYVDSVAYAGADVATLDRQPLLTDATVQPVDDFVTARSAEISGGVNVLAIILLLFAAIALVVSVLVIANTFSILFAQRSRDFALLRCVGATQRQVLRSVRVEALVLGLASSSLGVLVGAAGGHALVALARILAPSAPLGDVSLSPAWVVGAFAVGLVVTLVASWLPTRRVVAVGPLAALRPAEDVDVRTTSGRLRIALGLVTTATGVALLALAVSAGGSSSPLVMVVGGTAAFTGVLLLGPVHVPALIRLVGVPVGRIGGAPARLATGNAVRNPRRTAATTASLLIGVTLTTAVLTGLASARASVDDEMDLQHPVDAQLTASGVALPETLTGDVRAVDSVEDAVPLLGAPAKVSDGVGAVTLLAAPDADTAGRVSRADADFLTPAPGEIWLAYDVGAESGDRVRVRVGTTDLDLRVRTGEGWGGAAAVVAPATLAALTERAAPYAVWVRATDGTDPEDLAGDLEAVGTPAGAELESGLAKRAYVSLQLDVLTASVVALLGVAVLIALLGIGNTLGLSVLERGREHALLRALGLTRRQLRAMLATEALLLSVVATLLGTAIGVTFAWVGVEVLVRQVVPQTPLVLPWGQLALVVLVAGVAGLLACLLPARRAARTAPAAGLSVE